MPLIAIRFVKNSPALGLCPLAARSAFWCLGKPFLQSCARLLGLPVAEGSSLVDLLWLLCSSLIEGTDDEVSKCVEQRLVTMTKVVEQSDVAYGEVDELQDVLERRDEKDVAKEFEDYHQDKEELATVREDFRTKVAKVVKGGGKPGGPILNSDGKKYPRSLPKGVIEHSTAKILAPPDCFVWRSLTTGAWCGRHPPYGEITRSWAKHGEQQAMILMLREVWTTYLIAKGLTTRQCPIANSFP